VQAEVTSSFELDKEQKNIVELAISEATGVKKIILSIKVDETLIGGLIVKIGSKMIDNSIKTKLNRLEIAMRGAN
jgi:F-type H+-transporting ATPase subunit delta